MKTNYNIIANNYNERYAQNKMAGVLGWLKKTIAQNNFTNILEVGCGTGYWLNKLKGNNHKLYGLDYSVGMLKKAAGIDDLINASADSMPVKNNSMDFVIVVNAIHHFKSPANFFASLYNLLKSKGQIAIILVDIRDANHKWYIYDYFVGTREYDLNRIPAIGTLLEMMTTNGFKNVKSKTLEITKKSASGQKVFDDHFLSKLGNSTLADLNERDYANGIEKIRREIEKNPARIFESNIVFKVVYGSKP